MKRVVIVTGRVKGIGRRITFEYVLNNPEPASQYPGGSRSAGRFSSITSCKQYYGTGDQY